MVKCAVCSKEFETDRQLHGHLKAHNLRMASYYQEYFPKKDLYTGDIIKFKSKEYYFNTDFNTRINMQKWLKSKPVEEAKKYCEKVLKGRVEKKQLVHTPTQVELRTIMSPPIQFYQIILNDYYKSCSNLGLKNRFNKIPEENIFNINIDKKTKICVDTREQSPLKLDHPIKLAGLKFGDYTLENPEDCCKCYIERKSIRDFVGTLSGGFERFRNEIKRAQDAGAYLIVLTERKINECMAFNKLPHVSKKVKVTPEYVFRDVRDLMQEFVDLQFLFVDGREESSRVMKKILFDSNCSARDYDLQLAYDLKIL